MRYARTFAALGLALAMVACSGSDESAPSTPAPPLTATHDTAGIEIVLTEWSVVVSQGIVSPGTFTFRAANQGSNAHVFQIEGNGQQWKSDPIAPGGSARLTPTLTAGTYTVSCPITDGQGSHREKGMSSTFSVQ